MNINDEDDIEIPFKDNLICPKCSAPINCSDTKVENGLELIPEEFTKYFCEKCSIEFCFISCLFCKKYLYMKIHPNALKYNGLNGFNIICYYKACENIFYVTECIKCKRFQKQKRCIKEGDIITCIYNDCKFQYIQSNCIIKECTELYSIEKPKNFHKFPFGIMHTHNNKIMFQKINCNFCWRPIVYISTKSKKNKYWECQKVVCPYQDCKGIFNRIICPFCNEEIYVDDGWYAMGSSINCHKCNNSFSKILCPSCKRINVDKTKSFKLGVVRCGFENCLKQNYMINCIYCRKINIFKFQIPKKGQIIKCGYCSNTFNEILCPFCNLKNPFPFADFSYGKVYQCKYITCLKEFQCIICPNCLSTEYVKDTEEGKKIKCHNCNIIFMNWACPFCYSSILDKNSTLKFGQMVTCPSKKCGKSYSFIRCFKCDKLVYSKENESILGKSVMCTHKGCGSYSLVVNCPFCEIKTIFKGQNKNYNEGDDINCKNCKQIFKFKKIIDKYDKQLEILEGIEGQTIEFGIGQTDENFLMKQNLFFDKEKIKRSRLFPTQFISDEPLNGKSSLKSKIKISITLQECIVCHRNYKESIFYPCGHRCTCYNCAVEIFTVLKKCPRCNKEAKCIIKKLYD